MSVSPESLSPEKLSATLSDVDGQEILSKFDGADGDVNPEMAAQTDLMSIGSSQMASSESLVSTIFMDGPISEDRRSLGTLNEDAPAIDPHALQDIETHAKRISDQLFHMMALLKSNLCKISGFTLDSIELHSRTVDSVCDSVDNNIKAMYALIAKSEEVSKELAVALSIKDEVNEIKRVIDQLEVVIMKDVKKN